MAQPTTSNTTLEYFDGFDDYNTSQLNRYWTTYAPTGGNAATVSAGNGRNGTAACSINNTSGSPSYVLNTFTAQVTRTIGGAFKLSANNSGNGLMALWDGTSVQVDVRTAAGGTLAVTRNGTVLATSTFSMSTGVYYYIELSATINSSSGSFTLKVNGATVASGTGVNTQVTGNASSTSVSWGFHVWGSNTTAYIDDVYSRADATFCGDVRVESGLPTGNGGTIQLTPLTGTNHGEVADNPADDDTSYNVAGSSGLEDLYTYPAIPSTSGTVYAVMTVPVMRNDSAGTVTVESAYHSGGTDYYGTGQTIGSTTYTAYPDIQGQNPATSTAWTVTTVNAAQFGLKRTA